MAKRYTEISKKGTKRNFLKKRWNKRKTKEEKEKKERKCKDYGRWRY